MKQIVKILNEEGMHDIPAAAFAKLAMAFNSSINILFGEKSVNAKSIIGLIELDLQVDNEFTITAEGDDQETAINSLVELTNNKFILQAQQE